MSRRFDVEIFEEVSIFEAAQVPAKMDGGWPHLFLEPICATCFIFRFHSLLDIRAQSLLSPSCLERCCAFSMLQSRAMADLGRQFAHAIPVPGAAFWPGAPCGIQPGRRGDLRDPRELFRRRHKHKHNESLRSMINMSFSTLVQFRKITFPWQSVQLEEAHSAMFLSS